MTETWGTADMAASVSDMELWLTGHSGISTRRALSGRLFSRGASLRLTFLFGCRSGRGDVTGGRVVAKGYLQTIRPSILAYQHRFAAHGRRAVPGFRRPNSDSLTDSPFGMLAWILSSCWRNERESQWRRGNKKGVFPRDHNFNQCDELWVTSSIARRGEPTATKPRDIPGRLPMNRKAAGRTPVVHDVPRL